jgi:hypothetical protein
MSGRARITIVWRGVSLLGFRVAVDRLALVVDDDDVGRGDARVGYPARRDRDQSAGPVADGHVAGGAVDHPPLQGFQPTFTT